ncbi:MAG: lytic transglycosylase domain-containing protein [Synergistetes bacterium]|nr:MAG: lytic transglycosylase, catalytic, putative [bacterium 42_11]MBC7331017.1 lytic transglycosylase domain-containing protein [Synergistota bacterium]
MALDGLKRVIRRIEEIRRGFDELSKFRSRSVEQYKAPSFKEVFLKEVERSEEEGVKRENRVEDLSPLLPRDSFKEDSSIEDVVNRASKLYKLDPKLVMAVIEAESNFNPKALSPKGAMGLMQLMPDTAREMGVRDPFDVEENIMGGVKYLNYLSEKYKGNLELVLAAYNAGPGAVDKYGGIPPYKETQDYVRKVLSIYRKLKR